MIVWGPSMAVIESQIEVIAAWFETKHGCLWWTTLGRNDSVGTKHDCLWRPIWGRGCVIRVHVESELDDGRYGRGSGWSKDVMPRLRCQLFRSCRFIFRRHVEYQEATCLSRYDAFNARIAHLLINKARDVSSYPNHDRWFKFLNGSSIPAVDLIFKS